MMPAARLPAVLFDLDGTLIDSIELILNSARFAFEGRTSSVPSDAEWLSGVGTPLVDMFRNYARDAADVDVLIARYREYQMPNHDRLVRAYDGVVETVRGLQTAQHPLAVVNRGGATAREVVAFGARIKRAVMDRFGLSLRAEPVCVGFVDEPDVDFLAS